MGNTQSETLVKGLNSQQKLAWHCLTDSNEKLIRQLQMSEQAKNQLQAKNVELSNEIDSLSSKLFDAESKPRVQSTV